MSAGASERFRAFPHQAHEAIAPLAAKGARIDERALDVFDGDSLSERLVRALARRRALAAKEVFESFEFFTRARKRVRGRRMADLCCGHGLVGALFATFERGVDEVLLVDIARPASHHLILEALDEVAPWAPPKLQFVEARLTRARELIPTDAHLLAVHACGLRTDRILELARERRVPVAALPCCPQAALAGVPPALVRELGPALACDTARTIALEQDGLCVRWGSIPRSITPMNRLILAWPRTPNTPRRAS